MAKKSSQAKSDPPSGELSKGLGDKILEVARAGQLLRDCKVEIRKGKEYYLPAIAGQLRALITDQSGPPNGPLLTKVSKEIGKEIEIFYLPKHDNFVGPQPIFELFGFPMSMTRQLPGQVKCKIRDIPHIEIMRFNNKIYRVRNIVEWFANKNGGAHYSSKIPYEFSEYLQYTAAIDGTDAMIFSQIADAACSISHDVIKDVFSWDLYTTLGIDTPPNDVAMILDAVQKTTGMRIALAYTAENSLIFHLTGLDGRLCSIQTECLQFTNGLLPIHLELNVDENFHSTMRIFISGALRAEKKFNFPILCQGDWKNYDVLFNRSEDRISAQNYRFGISHTFVSKWTSNEYDRSDLTQKSRIASEDFSSGMVVLSETGFIHCPPGKTDMTLCGDFRWSKTSEYEGSPA